jgi:hypothetical protein
MIYYLKDECMKQEHKIKVLTLGAGSAGEGFIGNKNKRVRIK